MSQPELVGVEGPALAFLSAMGWRVQAGAELDGASRVLAPVLLDDFKAALLRLNPWLDANGVEAALREIRKVHEEDLMHSNRAFWRGFIQQSSFQLPHTENGHTRPKTVRFIDSSIPKNNSFCAVPQWVGKNAQGELFRPDILLFVNGLPLGVIECKAAHEKLDQAISQLRGYQHHFPKHFYFNQVCAVMNRADAKYGAIGTPAEFYFRYRLEAAEEEIVTALAGEEPSAQQRLLWALFEPTRFIELVRHFVLFEQEESGLIKKLPRYQQWRAVRKIIARIKADRGGVVWHTQGSGKSLTMALLARQLRVQETGLDNPSILLLTDRTDLDGQLFDTFNHVGLHPERAVSVQGLQERLTNDYGGIFTSTIQKFQESREQPASQKKAKADPTATTRVQRIERDGRWFMLHQRKESGVWRTEQELEVDFQVLSTKSNFYVLVDEAHRSHYGFLGAFMRASLPNAKLIAFTGTPLLKAEKSTLAEFGMNAGLEEYIDVYALQDAVDDGFTLPIRYLDGIAEQTVDGLLEKDFEKLTAGKSQAKKALMRQQLLRERRRNPKRFEQIARHLVAHYELNGHAKGMKALLVCEGRPAAVRYKERLDNLMAERARAGLPVFESRVVISLGSITANRSEESDAAEQSAMQSIEERVREAVRLGETPIAVPADEIPNLTNTLFKLPFGDESQNTEQRTRVNNVAILIVSDMLLTGYDAPVLGTLYLDKRLQEHTLLQAIARVNRTRKNKTAGYIVDYYGIVEDLDAALTLYGGDVTREQLMAGPESDIPKLQAACQRVLNLLPKKHDLLTEPERFKADAEKALDPERYLDRAEDFLAEVGAFNRLLDVVLPHPAGAPFKPYFVVFSQLRATLRNLLLDQEHREAVTAEESALLTALTEQHVAAYPVVSLLEHEISIFDRQAFSELRKLSGTGKAALVMKNQLKHVIDTGKAKEPGFFGALDEELQRLINEEKEGRLEQLSFLEQMEGLMGRIQQKDDAALHAGFESESAIATFNYLNDQVPELSQSVTQRIFEDEEFYRTVDSPNWHRTPTVVDELEKVVRKHLLGVSGWERKTAKQHAKKLVERLRKET